LNAEDAITSPQDQADANARFSGISRSPSLVRIPASKSRQGALQLCLSAKSISKEVSCYEGRRGSKSSGKQLGGTSSDVVREAEMIFKLAIPLTLTSEFPSIAPNDGTTDNLALLTVNSGRLDDTQLYRPVLEGFIMQVDDGEPSITFDKLDQLKSVTAHASIQEELCKSACMQNLASSIPTGLLEDMDGKNKPLISDTVTKINDNYGCLSEERKQMRAVDTAEFNQKMEEDIKALEQLRRTLVPRARPVPKFDKLPTRLSPVSRVWDSLNPELPCIAEENENTEEIAKGNVPEVWTSSFKRKPEKKLEKLKSSMINNKEKQTLAVGASGVKWAKSIYNSSNKPKLTGKISLRGGPSLSEMDPKRNNTVSSITSFIPLVQQKQAPAALPVKRDIKVKAIKAAEAAKCLAENKEYEGKTKKEALTIERARQEKENLKQLELQKKRKEEEHKKKEADMTAKKRQREERDKKEKERKQMCLEEERKQHREYKQMFRAEKQEKDRKLRTT
ncbi:hypothetical protein UlMin_002804, partial [Ulmus minor]